MSHRAEASTCIAVLLLIALISPTAAFAQKGKSLERKVPIPNGPGVSELIYAVTSNNTLISFNSFTPGTVSAAVAITGLQAGEQVLAIDFRPLNRELYALGSTNRVYTINRTTGAATVLNATPFSVTFAGLAFGWDFNPVVDLIRATSDLDFNVRVNPNTGALTATDTNLAYAAGDPNAGANPNVVGSAYTNSFAGATTTTLYDIDSNLDTLTIQNPPNNGTLNTVGNLGVNTSDQVGFDISRASSVAFASLTVGGTSSLFTINLTTGAATVIGAIGAGLTIRDISVAPVAQSGDLIISEFRLRGPGGISDEFIEIYNPLPAALTVAAFDGSAGFALSASESVVRFVIPNGTVIPSHGHYLGVNSVGYSLGSYPAGNGTTATGDATYTLEILDNFGIALFNTANPANFNVLNRLDAVGSSTESNPIFKEGTGYPALGPPPSFNYSFFRNLRSGLPQDTNNNFASGVAEPLSATPQNDFVFADTGTFFTASGQRLGAPGPENLSSPIQRNATIKASLVAPCMSKDLPPNRVRTGSGNSGTLEIRRKFTNNSAGPVTRLRFRVVDVTGLPAIVPFAGLFPVTSASSNTDPQPCGGGTVSLQGLTLETPPAQSGGGFNSTLSADTITLGAPIAPGASINVNFRLNIQQAGTFRFFVNVEALP